jgi:hypothetical protein
VERVLGASTVRGRVGEWANGFEQLDDRPGQPCVMISGRAFSCGTVRG